MFESFSDQARAAGERRRWAVSLGVGVVAYAGIVAAAVILGGAASPQPVQEDQPIEVVFAKPEPPPPPPPPPPEPEPASPEPPPAAPQVAAPKHLKRKPPDPAQKPKELKAPAEISEEKPEEKDAKDFAVAAAAPGEGDAAGREGGTGIPGTQVASIEPEAKPVKRVRRKPVQLPENATPPRMKAASGSPTFPAEMKALGKEGLVILKVVIDENGRITAVQMMKGEEPFASAAIAWAKATRWEPAIAASGEKLPVFRILQIPFRLRM